MMKRSTRYAAACLALFVVGSAVAGFALSGTVPKTGTNEMRTEETKPAQVNEINGYRAWTLVNPKPVYITSQLDLLCALPSAADERAETARNPHARKMISVYVNALGQPAMMTERNPKFAVGSVIVKEKFSRRKKDAPELLTVMVKREQGYNPSSGDWEYMIVNGAGTKIEARGKLENCQACHVSMKDSGFVYRSYAPDEVRKSWR